MKTKNTSKLYNLPKIVKFCKRCTISNQRPRTVSQKGICSACNSLNIKERKLNGNKERKNLLNYLKDLEVLTAHMMF